MKVEMVSKISASGMMGSLKPYIKGKADGETVMLFRAAGVVTGYKAGTGDKGDWVKLLGDFRAQKIDGDGTITASTAIFVPRQLEELIVSQMSNKDVAEVEFAVEIGIKASEKSTTGYTYVVVPVVAVQQSARVQYLMEHFASDTPLLENLEPDMYKEKPSEKAKKK